ncbi:rCG26814 [Rattus norvegicus]|uniref:RCG26814 n=1 Tax=Rattus norvegicus TaxID=10116 RepID=A6HPL1_RAT|nr:rCG26814 [Rattus norvegicus]
MVKCTDVEDGVTEIDRMLHIADSSLMRGFSPYAVHLFRFLQ